MPQTPNPKPKTITIRLSEEHREYVETQARDEGISPSEFIRYCLMRERRR